MRGFSGLSDFFLRKAFKFALKRNLGKYLASELDPNQLDVQLGQGTIELRQLLLNCNELNEQLVSQLPHNCYSCTALSVCAAFACFHQSYALSLCCHTQHVPHICGIVLVMTSRCEKPQNSCQPQHSYEMLACRTLHTGRSLLDSSAV